MDLKLQLEAQDALIKTLAQSPPTTRLVITPDLLKRSHFRVASPLDTVFFVGFDRQMPLRIPKNLHVKEDLWIISSIVEYAGTCRVSGNVNFFNTDLMLLEDFDYVAELRVFDPESLNSHITGRGYHRNPANMIAKRYTSVEQRRRMLAAFDAVPKIDFLQYVKNVRSVKLSENTDGSYTVTGTLALPGPYEFNIPEGVTLNGDLFFFDTINQRLPNSFVVTGMVDMGSFF